MALALVSAGNRPRRGGRPPLPRRWPKPCPRGPGGNRSLTVPSPPWRRRGLTARVPRPGRGTVGRARLRRAAALGMWSSPVHGPMPSAARGPASLSSAMGTSGRGFTGPGGPGETAVRRPGTPFGGAASDDPCRARSRKADCGHGTARGGQHRACDAGAINARVPVRWRSRGVSARALRAFHTALTASVPEGGDPPEVRIPWRRRAPRSRRHPGVPGSWPPGCSRGS